MIGRNSVMPIRQTVRWLVLRLALAGRVRWSVLPLRERIGGCL